MIRKLAHKVVIKMIEENIIDILHAQFYEYAFVIKIESIITITTILAIAIYHKLVGPTILFLIFFLELRKRTGGYHAETFSRCYIMSNVIYLLFIKIIYPFLMKERMEIVLIWVSISSVLILILGTVNHPNWNLDYREYLQMSFSARKLICLEYFSVLLSFVFGIQKKYVILISFAIVLCAITMLLSKACNKIKNGGL